MTIKDTTYFQVQAWMVTKLGLKTVERDVFAIIYGYSQDEESDYHGSLAYMAELTGYSRNSICTALKSLTEKQYIIKTEKIVDNIKSCRYVVNMTTVQAACTPVQRACTPIQAACTNNISNTKNENKKVLSKDNTGISSEFIFGKDAETKKPKRKTNLDELEDAKLLIKNYTNNCTLIQQLMILVNTKFEICSKERRHFYSTTIKNYLDELSRTFGGDVNQQIEAVKLSIRYNATTKVMVPNNVTRSNVKELEGFTSPDITKDGLNHTKSEREF